MDWWASITQLVEREALLFDRWHDDRVLKWLKFGLNVRIENMLVGEIWVQIVSHVQRVS